MKKFSKLIRILTVSPLMAMALSLLLYFCVLDSFSGVWMLIVCIFCLSVFPTLAYLIENKFHIYKKFHENYSPRECERFLAIYFSLISYFVLTLVTFVTNQPTILKEMVLTYLFSVILIFIFSVVLKINASGHMCGVVGPIIFLSYSISLYFLISSIVLILIVYSSLKLKRHTPLELFMGTIIPIISFVFSILII